MKNDEFKHEDLGQLNAYVGYYKKNEMVEYALSGMDNPLFVSTLYATFARQEAVAGHKGQKRPSRNRH